MPRAQLAVFAGHSRESLSGAGVDANETGGGLELSLTFGRNLGLTSAWPMPTVLPTILPGSSPS
ncbi:MAG: hypothetical protein R3E65_08460 [Steroidobacteraceae bacterium]